MNTGKVKFFNDQKELITNSLLFNIVFVGGLKLAYDLILTKKLAF